MHVGGCGFHNSLSIQWEIIVNFSSEKGEEIYPPVRNARKIWEQADKQLLLIAFLTRKVFSSFHFKASHWQRSHMKRYSLVNDHINIFLVSTKKMLKRSVMTMSSLDLLVLLMASVPSPWSLLASNPISMGESSAKWALRSKSNHLQHRGFPKQSIDTG